MVDPIYTDALIYASLLAMLAIGLTLTYITTRVPNFAHASVAMVGAYIALIITRVVDVNAISIPISFGLLWKRFDVSKVLTQTCKVQEKPCLQQQMILGLKCTD